jgi:hypothetical protein
MKREMIKFHHYKEHEIFVIGSLRFDHYFTDRKEAPLRSREAFLRSKNLDPNKKMVTVFGPSPIMYPARRGLGAFLTSLKREKKLSGDPNIFIRIHPHDSALTWQDFEGKEGIHIERAGTIRVPDTATKGQKIEMAKEDLRNLTETFLYSDVIINFVSTTNLEACIFDKPLISLGFPEYAKRINEYEYHKTLIKNCGVRVAENEHDLLKALNVLLQEPSRGASERARVRRELIKFEDGLSHTRALESIRFVLHNHGSAK